jgi:trigger factor
VKTTIEKLSPTRAKLTIAVTPDELKPSIDHAYSHIAEQVNIPGFRKGKVPPQLIDQRVGREEVLNHAVSDGLDKFFRQAVEEEKIRVLGRPEADIKELPNVKDFTGDLVVTVEVDVRPEFVLPNYEGLKLVVEPVTVSADDVRDELDALRSRFGTLVTVNRPARTGDFAQLDLVATINGEEVDTANNISYEIGSGELIEGIDEALDTLTAGESTSFESTLIGGDSAGQQALINVTLLAVKERELPEADDDFAQIASQFDTISELKADIKEQVEKSKAFGQVAQARDMIVDELVKKVDIPVPQGLIDEEVHRHLESENRLEDDVHRAEVAASSEQTFRSQILIDAIADAEDIKVNQDELTQYLVQSSAQYGMEPGEFIKVLDENGQIPAMVGEVARGKTLALILEKANVVDTKGKKIDVTPFTGIARDADDDGENLLAPAAADDHAGHDHS